MTFIDETLDSDLAEIAAQAKTMQANNVPFAHWVMEQQTEAIKRFNARQIISATPPAPSED